MTADERETFNGYLLNKDGSYNSPSTVIGMDGVADFLTNNIMSSYELRIVDGGDIIVFQVIDRVLIYPIPKHGTKNNIWDNELKKFISVK